MPRSRRAPDPYGLAGKLAVVTGATRGIGRAVAEELARAGARVVVSSRGGADCDRVAATLARRHGVPTLGVPCDVADPASVRQLFARVRAWDHGPVHALANIAGHGLTERLWTTPLHQFTQAELTEAFDRVHRVDVAGARHCTWHALKDMRRVRAGSILYVSSTPALAGYTGTPFTEAKAALLGLMRDVARENGPKGVRANAIAPGNIRTDWLDHVSARERRRLERENPLQRFGEPEEVARLAVALLGAPGGFVTGQVVVVDGGTVSH